MKPYVISAYMPETTSFFNRLQILPLVLVRDAAADGATIFGASSPEAGRRRGTCDHCVIWFSRTPGGESWDTVNFGTGKVIALRGGAIVWIMPRFILQLGVETIPYIPRAMGFDGGM